MQALEIKNLSKNFGGLKVLENISFSLEPGERRALIGPNGAGKTTLFNLISGTLKPNSGGIFLFGENITNLPTYRRARLGLARTFQKNNLFFGLSLLDNINLALRMGNPHFNPQEILKTWDLWQKRKNRVEELSYGEQRQVEILLALAQSPKIIMLDEPTAGMSQHETQIITRMISALPQDVTILIIEHDMDVVFNLAEQITVLHFGQILYTGDREEIKSNPQVKNVYLGTTWEEDQPKC